ncbi:helix-turn-helix transcriptional regulator [Kribbella sp. CA-293567]|uniref:helix-turn-helix transcriptional regulator n=1 Tax=Kribbella sp. CA-293567 TaxID=3002436 RepID=UPI0022DE2E76|nr:helix-turn-helix transcriptional regulator [Kribbella sp. CA-293567]WBQ06086.1 helix-turn-helix transcriptional regulator [Kribbella sp. CA-293567]
MDYRDLSDFLRKRREALQPEDLGLPRGRRRRTPGLRREEVAALAVMSTDYYSRLEGGRGPQPSTELLAAIARALRLTLDERDHLYLLAGHGVPPRSGGNDHVNPGLLRIMDRLVDTPAQVMNRLGETLLQTAVDVAFEGELTNFEGLERSGVYRWFLTEGERDRYADDEVRANHSRVLVSGLRSVYATDGDKSRAGTIVRALLDGSAEFRRLWDAHEVGIRHLGTKRFVHPVVGNLEFHCQLLDDQQQQQTLLVFTATPGSESAEKLALLAVLGQTEFEARQS